MVSKAHYLLQMNWILLNKYIIQVIYFQVSAAAEESENECPRSGTDSTWPNCCGRYAASSTKGKIGWSAIDIRPKTSFYPSAKSRRTGSNSATRSTARCCHHGVPRRALQCDHFSRICDWKLLRATMKKYLGAPVRLTRSAYLCLCWGSFKGF